MAAYIECSPNNSFSAACCGASSEVSSASYVQQLLHITCRTCERTVTGQRTSFCFSTALIMIARPCGSAAKYCPGTIRRQPVLPYVSICTAFNCRSQGGQRQVEHQAGVKTQGRDLTKNKQAALLNTPRCLQDGNALDRAAAKVQTHRPSFDHQNLSWVRVQQQRTSLVSGKYSRMVILPASVPTTQ